VREDRDASGGLVLVGVGAAQLLCLVEDDGLDAAREVVDPAAELVVADDQDIGVIALHLAALGGVVWLSGADDVRAQAGQRLGELALPVVRQVRGADDERRQKVRVAQREQAAHRLAQAELVGEQQPARGKREIGGHELVLARIARRRQRAGKVRAIARQQRCDEVLALDVLRRRRCQTLPVRLGHRHRPALQDPLEVARDLEGVLQGDPARAVLLCAGKQPLEAHQHVGRGEDLPHAALEAHVVGRVKPDLAVHLHNSAPVISDTTTTGLP
jgi:hypothetical protein